MKRRHVLVTACSLIGGAGSVDARPRRQDTIKVGILHSLSGTMAISETTLKDTVLMMIAEQNKKGGLLGKKLEAVVVDPASNWPLFAEKAAQLLTQDKVAVVFGCWTSVSRKSVLPVFEKNNGLLFYPVQYEGEESSKNVIYTGAAPNQQAIPAVDYLMNDVGVKRWVLEGTDYVYPRTTNTHPRGVSAREGRVRRPTSRSTTRRSATPTGRRASPRSSGSDRRATRRRWCRRSTATRTCRSTRNSATRRSPPKTFRSWRSRSARKSCPDWTRSRSSATSRPGITSRACSTPANKAFIDMWKTYIKNPKRTTNDPMEAHYVGFNLWVKAVEKAKSTDVEAVLAALPGLETPNLTGGIARMLPNHHITKPVYIGEVRADGQFDVVWKTNGTVPGDAWSDFLPASKPIEADWVKLKCGNYNTTTKSVLGTELQVNMPMGGRRLRWLLLAIVLVSAVLGPLAAQTPDEAFLASVAELREASFLDKEAIAERLIAAGHPATRDVLTALLEDRLYVRTSDQQVFIVKTTDGEPGRVRRSWIRSPAKTPGRRPPIR